MLEPRDSWNGEPRLRQRQPPRHAKVLSWKNSSSPEQTGAAGKLRNTQMLEDVDELMLAKFWCDHAESAISPLEETDSAAEDSVLDTQSFSLLLSRDEEMEAF